MKNQSSQLKILTLTLNLLKGLIVIVGTYFLLQYIFIAISRMNYPFELEILEGNILSTVRRVTSGLKIYTKPSIKFIPYNYPPLYYYISAFVTKIFGTNFFSLRFVSFISSLLSFYLIFQITKKETKSDFAGMISVFLFTASYGASGAWFDVARVDSLFLAFILSAIYQMRFKKSASSNFISGVCISCAIFTKQTAIILILPILLFLLLSKQKKSTPLITTIILIFAFNTLLLNIIHKGWYYYYVWQLPGKQTLFIVSESFNFWFDDIFGHFLFAFLLGCFYLISNLKSKDKHTPLFYIAILLGSIISSWHGRTYAGGGHNALLPTYAILAIIFGIAINNVSNVFQFQHHRKKIIQISLYFIALIQLVSLYYNPKILIPTRKDELRGKIFIESLTKIKGNVYLAHHQYLTQELGKDNFADYRALEDVIRANANGEGERLEKEFINLIKNQELKAIIGVPESLPEFIYNDYEKKDFIYITIFWAQGGLNEYLFTPKFTNIF